jgi:fumarylacetoacetate (FAA) hydrolase
MKLATLRGDGPDGKLVVVSKDLSKAVSAEGIAPTLLQALERWQTVESALRELSDNLNAGAVQGAFIFDQASALAPLPRTWQWLDGSVYRTHAELMATAFGTEPAKEDVLLMYQGMSHHFIAPTDPAAFPSEDDGIDFEGEFGVILDETPMGASPDEAAEHIKLVALVNDWSLRAIAPIEMKTGFGWISAKPACSIAPVVVTPDDLGESWREGAVDLPLHVYWNGKEFGRANGHSMAFNFPRLIAHAAHRRRLSAGTIIGSGTVSNANYREVGSSCISERRAIEILDNGKPTTGFMRFGDRLRMEVFDTDGVSVFGAIDQTVVGAGA